MSAKISDEALNVIFRSLNFNLYFTAKIAHKSRESFLSGTMINKGAKADTLYSAANGQASSYLYAIRGNWQICVTASNCQQIK